MANIKMLDISEMTAMKGDQDSYDFAIGERCLAIPRFAVSRFQLVFCYLGFKFFAEIIDLNKNFDNFIMSKHRLFLWIRHLNITKYAYLLIFNVLNT